MSTMKTASRARRIQRVRSRIHGTAGRPRLSVSFTNRHVVAQLIDDEKGVTIAYASSVKKNTKGKLEEKAEAVAAEIAGLAKASKVTAVVFDRRHKPYHGRVSTFAEAVRKQGLEF